MFDTYYTNVHSCLPRATKTGAVIIRVYCLVMAWRLLRLQFVAAVFRSHFADRAEHAIYPTRICRHSAFPPGDSRRAVDSADRPSTKTAFTNGHVPRASIKHNNDGAAGISLYIYIYHAHTHIIMS